MTVEGAAERRLVGTIDPRARAESRGTPSGDRNGFSFNYAGFPSFIHIQSVCDYEKLGDV